MKKYLICFLLALTGIAFVAATAEAQVVRKTTTSSDVSTNADTVIVTFTGVPARIKSISASITKLTGTAAGIALLQGSNDDAVWFDVNTDTLTLSDQATNKKFWAITSTSYYSYRVWYKSTGTQTSTIRATYVRRPDE